ncbi:hypothetical protein LCGC14_2101780 [marine sediment metagenome]|uniref:Transmembrane protein n=1 Tax=marine sediment metagenome TaxID=412755 RepID=A0A0F9GMW2_9ZZZZ
MNIIDFENVRTYMESVFILFFILSGTYLYSFRDSLPWLTPFVILSYGIIISLFGIYQYYEYLNIIKKKDDKPSYRVPRTIGAGIIWILWLIYGIIFKDVSLLFSPIIGYIQSSIVVLLVLLTYLPEIKENRIWTNIIFFCVLLLLFIPHSDTISHDMDKFILFIKIFVFYILYVLTETLHILQEENKIFEITTSSPIDYNKWIYKTEIKIIQSCWILLISKYLLLGVIFQFIPLCIELSKYKHEMDKWKQQILPTVNDNISIKKKPKKKYSTVKKKKKKKKFMSNILICNIGNIDEEELELILNDEDDNSNTEEEQKQE